MALPPSPAMIPPRNRRHLWPNKGTSGRQSCQAQKQHLWEDWWGFCWPNKHHLLVLSMMAAVDERISCFRISKAPICRVFWWSGWHKSDPADLKKMINWPIHCPRILGSSCSLTPWYLSIKASLWSPEMLETWILLFLMNRASKQKNEWTLHLVLSQNHQTMR